MTEYRSHDEDSTSSAWIPYGYTLTVYEDDSFSGKSCDFTGPNYTDAKTLKPACVPITGDCADVSSIVVKKTGKFGAARGYWRGITQTESVNFKVKYGLTSTKSTED